MPNELGIYDSPGERLRRERFQERRSEVLDTFLPMAVQGLGEAAASTDRSLTELQGMMNLQPPRIRPLRGLREGFAPEPSSAFGQVPMSAWPGLERERLRQGAEAARAFGEDIRGRPLREVADIIGISRVAEQEGLTASALLARPRPSEFEQTAFQREVELEAGGALEELAPSPGVLGAAKNATVGLAQMILEGEALERKTLGPYTRPIGRAVAQVATEAVVPQVPRPLRAAGVPDFPGREAVREAAGELGEVGGEFGILPSNLLPIPIADDILRILAKGVPIAARLLTRTGRQATREELSQLAAGARRFLTRTPPTEPAERQVVEEAVEALSREAAAPDDLANLRRDIAAELELAEAIGDTQRVARLQAEAGYLDEVAKAAEPEAVVPGLRDELQDVERELRRREIPFGGRAGVSPARARREARFQRGLTQPSAEGTTSELVARQEALSEILSELEVPAMGGGSRLTAAEVASRRAAGADLVSEAIPQSGKAEGREVWRRFFGAKQLSAKERAVWARQVYKDAEPAGFKVVPRGETQSDEVVGIMEQVMDEARAPVSRLPENERPFVQSLYDRVDRTTLRLKNADPEFASIALPDYFPHLFKPIKPGTRRAGAARGFVTKPGFKRERQLKGTLAEILRDRPDLDLVTWDPVDFVTRHEAAADNYIASLEAIRSGKAAGMILPANQAPADWVRPDFAPFRLRQSLQNHVMEPKFAQAMEQMFGVSQFDKHGVLKVAKQARTAGFALKVFGGLFQQIDFMWRAAGLGVSEAARGRLPQAGKAVAAWPRGIARGLSPGVDDALNKAALKNPNLKALYDNGLSAGLDPSFSETALRDVAAELGPIPGVKQALETVTSKWYGRFHTEMLEQAGLVNLEKNLRKGLPMDEAARKAVEETNVFFSSIPAWQSVWKSATVRDAMKFPFFATGELEAWFRLPVQAPAGFAGMMATTVAIAEMMNLAFTGKPLSLDQLTPFRRERDGVKPSKVLTGDIPFVDFNTGFLRPEMPWKGPMGRVLSLDLLGQADTPLRWALDPGFAFKTRLGQLPRAALDLMAIARGEAPAFGERVEGLGDAGKWLLNQVSPISVSGLTGTERGRIGAVGGGIQTSGFNVSAEPLFELLSRRFEEVTGETFNRETDWGRAARIPETAAVLDEMRKQGLAVGSEGAEMAQAREDVVQEAARDSLTQFAEGVRAGNEQAGRQFGEKFSDWKTFAAGAAELSVHGRDFPDPTSEHGQVLAEFYEVTPNDFLDGDPEEGTFTTDWVAFENARDALLSQMPEAWQEDYRAKLRLPPELQDVEARYNAARELRNQLEGVGEFVGLSREDYQLVKRLRAAVTQARNEAWADPARGGRELAPVRSYIQTEGEGLGYDERIINWTRALSTERDRAVNYNPAYVDFLGEHQAELKLFYPNLFTRRVVDELLAS